MAVFIRDGLHCACCGLKGARLIRSRDKAGYSHIDIYSRDYVLLTVDHIIPRKLGGANHINNYQILCEPCNGRKADKVISVEELRERLFPSRTFPIHAYA